MPINLLERIMSFGTHLMKNRPKEKKQVNVYFLLSKTLFENLNFCVFNWPVHWIKHSLGFTNNETDQACACDTRSVLTREHFCSRIPRWLLRLQWWRRYWHWLRVSWQASLREQPFSWGRRLGVLKVTNQRRGDISQKCCPVKMLFCSQILFCALLSHAHACFHVNTIWG